MRYTYQNGNVTVTINDQDGTKIRFTPDDEFRPEFPENIDICIGRRCDGGCKYCYDGATPNGPEADLLDLPFLNTLHNYTEIAINGNSINHSQLMPFLKLLNKKKIFTNMTVNQIHFEQKEDLIAELIRDKLIYGLGISLHKPTEQFLKKVQKYSNAVIHTINGVTTSEDYAILAGKDLKVLILGYKDKGRGHDYFEANRDTVIANQRALKATIPKMIRENWFKVLSFDNLALEQLEVKSLIPDEKWAELYQGEEGSQTMFIDLVDKTFGMSSLVSKDEMMPLMDDVRDMFARIRAIK